jgi:hypothetical protein
MNYTKYFIGRKETDLAYFENPGDIMEELIFRIRHPHAEDLNYYNDISEQHQLICGELSVEQFFERMDRMNNTLSNLPYCSMCKYRCEKPSSDYDLYETNFIVISYDGVHKELNTMKSELVSDTNAFFCSTNTLGTGIFAVYWIKDSIKSFLEYKAYFNLFSQYLFQKRRIAPSNYTEPITLHSVPFDKDIIINPKAERLKTDIT